MISHNVVVGDSSSDVIIHGALTDIKDIRLEGVTDASDRWFLIVSNNELQIDMWNPRTC